MGHFKVPWNSRILYLLLAATIPKDSEIQMFPMEINICLGIPIVSKNWNTQMILVMYDFESI